MKSTIKILPAFLLVLCSLQGHGQIENGQVAGSWQGVLNAGVIELRIIFNISLNEDLTFKATLDSPDQGQMGIPMGKVSLKDDSIRIEAPIAKGYYLGKFTSDTSCEGTWYQSGLNLPLYLEKLEEAFVLNRPQEPQAPFPYQELEVSFKNVEQGFSLGGTLTIPEGEGPFPAAVLVSGSGSQNRDEEILGHKLFKVIADHLTRNGIAVLRYDDRGVGASGGNPAYATTKDLAVDARSAFNYLLINKAIDPAKIGIVGHSEGGMIAFMLASSRQDIAFIVSLAGPGVDGKTILLEQIEKIASLSGVSDTVLEDIRKVRSGVFDVMIDKESYGEWKEETLKFVSKFYAEKEQGVYSEEDIEQGRQNIVSSLNESSYAWMRYFVMFDPSPLFKSIKCPVLALNGEKDCQVIAESNIAAIQIGLRSSGNEQVSTLIVPGLNHLFQHCETGLPNEYGVIEETFDPEILETMSDWIRKQLD